MLLTQFRNARIIRGSHFDDTLDYKYILADSRSVFDPSVTIFAAIRTGIGDGHRFIRPLAGRGVKAFLVEEVPTDCADLDVTFIVVPDVQQALSSVASEAMPESSRMILVTGSVGKTVTKELIYRSLIRYETVSRSPRSWNSRIGLPLAICDMFNNYHPSTAIVEVGIDGPRQAEIHLMSLPVGRIIGVVTPVTAEHDEAFPSHRDKIVEKVKLLTRCSDIFYVAGDKELEEVLREMTVATLHAVEQGNYATVFHALAAAVTEYCGYSADETGYLSLVDKRRRIYEGEFGNTFFLDNFTPDLRSLREALDFFRRHSSPEGSHVLVLGRLIDESTDVYSRAKDMAGKFGVDKIYVIADEDSHKGIIADFQNGKLFSGSQVLLFGEQEGLMAEFTDLTMTAGHDTSLEVDLDALAHNFNYYRSLLPRGSRLCAMVKASAYGMGSVEIGKALQSLGAAYLAVAVIDEGVNLRRAGITMPIMVLNPITNRYPALFSSRLEPAVFSIEELERLINEAGRCGVTRYPIHIKLDTGMHRVGFIEKNLDDLINLLNSTDTVKVASVFSHLATADCLDKDEYTLGQIRKFENMTARLAEGIGDDFRRHILNTAGMMRFSSEAPDEMARLGIGLYGISPLPGEHKLRPVASFFTHIISLKHWPAETPIGYGNRGMTGHDSVIATIPVGYADGINRHLGNGNVSFMVKGVACPTIGNVCMDLCMIDVTDVPDVVVGDKVEIFGSSASVERIADALDTIPYEVLTSVSPRVKRVYIKN